MNGSGDEEGKSGETSESDVKMADTPAAEGDIGPELPPGFDAPVEEEKKEEEPAKAEEKPTIAADEKKEEPVASTEEEKKDSDSAESKSTEDSSITAVPAVEGEPGYVSSALSGAKRIGGSALGMLQSLISSQ